MKRFIPVALIILIMFSLMRLDNPVCLAQETDHPHYGKKESCNVCGMYIERFRRTAAYVEFKSGVKKWYCGVSCAIRDINERGGMDEIKAALVTNWTSQEQVGLKSATYVIGSRLIPDMLPNIIAFGSKEEAEQFIKENRGRIESLDSLLASTSYRGLTVPFRIPSAAVPGKGLLNVSTGVSVKRMDHLLKGSKDITTTEGLSEATMVPDKMTTVITTQAIGYAFTDDLFCQVSVPYVWKKMRQEMRTGNNSKTYTDGLGDISVISRWRFWHDLYFDKHLGFYGAVSLPTGDYNSALRAKPTMQLGNGSPSFSPGLLYSQHAGLFWVHLAGLYKFNLENGDDYKFGDGINAGLAIHFLPNTWDLLGVEFDLDKTVSNTYKGDKVINTGRASVNCNFVYQRKLLLCWGGNLNLNLLYGFPMYEKVNGIQAGEEYHATLGLQWQTKF